MFYKCSEFYCIPIQYLHDGRWDFPKGEDGHKPFHCRIQTTLQWSVVTGLIVLWEMMSYAVKYHHTHLIVRALLTV